MDSRTWSGGTPRSPRDAALWRIITSGPQTRARVRAASNVARSTSRVTRPTSPCHELGALSTVTATSMSWSPAQSRRSSANSRSSGVRARRGPRLARSRRGPHTPRARPGGAERVRCRPRRTPRRRRVPNRPPIQFRRGHALPGRCPGCSRERGRDGADVPDGVSERLGSPGIAADRDRHLAHAEGVQHGELPGCELRGRPSTGTRSRVWVSWVSPRVLVTRNGRGSMLIAAARTGRAAGHAPSGAAPTSPAPHAGALRSRARGPSRTCHAGRPRRRRSGSSPR